MKTHPVLRAWPVILLIAVANFLVLRYLNFNFPLIGHDFYYILPRMVDVKLHYMVNGLSIQWYTPSFAGGMPAFPNPVYTQFTIPQALVTFFDLWTSVELSIVLCSSLAILFTYLTLRRNFELSKMASLLGTAGFAFNGFTLNHLMAGHLPYHIFFFTPLLFFVFSTPRFKPLLIVTVTAFIYALSLHSAGVEALISMGLSLIFSMFFFVKMRFDFKRFACYAGGVGLGAAIAAAKLSAVLAFMGRFPREIETPASQSMGSGILGIGAQLLGFPFFRLLGIESKSILQMFFELNNNPWGMWEQDTYVTFPVIASVLVVLTWLLGTGKGRIHIRSWWQTKSRWIFVGFFILWFTVELIVANGPLFDVIKHLPILKSFHVNIRFTSVFILPLCLAGAMAYAFIEQKFLRKSETRRNVGIAVLVLCGLNTLAYEYRVPEDTILQTFDSRRITETFNLVSQGHLFPVKNVNMVRDDEVFISNTSDIRPYEPIFGKSMEALKTELRLGPNTQIFDDKFNMTNPASLVFPDENGLRMFECIHTADRENMENFINRKNTTWKVSGRQTAANWISFFALLVFLGLSIFQLPRKILNS